MRCVCRREENHRTLPTRDHHVEARGNEPSQSQSVIACTTEKGQTRVLRCRIPSYLSCGSMMNLPLKAPCRCKSPLEFEERLRWQYLSGNLFESVVRLSNHLDASMLEIDLSSSPLNPKARRGGGARDIPRPSCLSLDIFQGCHVALTLSFFKWHKCRRNTERGNKGKSHFYNSDQFNHFHGIARGSNQRG